MVIILIFFGNVSGGCTNLLCCLYLQCNTCAFPCRCLWIQKLPHSRLQNGFLFTHRIYIITGDGQTYLFSLTITGFTLLFCRAFSFTVFYSPVFNSLDLFTSVFFMWCDADLLYVDSASGGALGLMQHIFLLMQIQQNCCHVRDA